MRLTIQVIDAPALPGGRALALCDEAGVMLPNQTACVVDCGLDGSTVTVTLMVDGDRVVIGPA